MMMITQNSSIKVFSRRSRNNIRVFDSISGAITNMEGILIWRGSEISKAFCSYYGDQEGSVYKWISLTLVINWPRISFISLISTSHLVILRLLLSIPDDKSTGLDSINSCLFKKAWKIVSMDIINNACTSNDFKPIAFVLPYIISFLSSSVLV